MSYQVLARKWRPQTFSEVIGQETVTRTLQNAIQSGRIAHAFLFSGIRGVGKTTTARILAKALNCHEGPTASPCGTCVSCQEIARSGSVDVLEIDAASNRRIDDVRELRESVRYGTARDRYKIFIIDEVHMLTNEAFNALLKTLEEPPPHVKLILATTEHHKIPVTITSRCQQYHFKPIPFTIIFEKLREICADEGIQISDYALRAVASVGQGSMRDAQSSLDRILAFSGREVLDGDVRALLGLVDSSHLHRVLGCVVGEDRPSLVREVKELAEQGVDPLVFCRRLIEHVRNLLVFRTTGWDETLLNLPDNEKPLIEEQASRVTELDLIRFYDLLTRTESELRWHPHPRVHLELALVKLVELRRLPLLESVLGSLTSGAPVPSGSAQRSRPEVRNARQPEANQAGSRQPAPPARPTAPPHPGAAEPAGPAGSPPEVAHFLSAVQRDNLPLYHSLEHASAILLAPGCLTIRFPESEGAHSMVVGGEFNLQFLTDLATKFTSAPSRVDIVKEQNRRQESVVDPVQDPGVQSFLEKFPGKVMVERKVDS